jgi:choline dehydrogenase-like flavoprotein
MLHQIRTSRRCLTDRERTLLLQVARAALPAGRVFPAAGPEVVSRVEGFLAGLPPYLLRAYRGLLTALDNAALLRHRRRFGNLAPARQLALLDDWHQGGVARRLGVRLLLAPLKVAHFDHPDFYRSIGCVYEFEAPTPERKPRYFTERVHGPDELEAGDTELECDVVVIGSGAGGAVVARELAELGHAVVLLEEGAYFDRTDFTGRSFDMQARMYKNAGATFAIGNVGIPVPVGRTVGGSTTINSGTCYRTPGRILSRWRDQLGLSELTEAHLDPYFSRVETVLGVEQARAEHLGGAARVIARGCDVLGYAHRPLHRNAPDCDGKGVCCFGCPTDAKRSTNVSYVPMALRAGAELFTGVKVTRILTEGGRASGVRARVPGIDGGPPRTLTVRARAVVVSCGTLSTPVLLQRSGLGGASGQLGRNLSIHPAAAGVAVFDEDISGFNAIPQGYSIDEFYDQGILFEGASAPFEITMAAMPFVGPRLIDLAERFDRVAMFGYMIADQSRGRIRMVGGRPVITYVLDDRDVATLTRGAEILARVFFAAGAREVHLPIHGFDALRSVAQLNRLRRARVRASDFELSAYHPLGTARMGGDPRHSVVGPDHQAHDVPGLYVVDGSAVPSSLGVNPQITIMALATRAAERIDDALAS